MVVYREDLRWPPLRCAAQGCRNGHSEEDLWFHPVCHPASPTWVRRKGAVLTLSCARCDRDLVSVVVDPRETAETRSGVRPASHG